MLTMKQLQRPFLSPHHPLPGVSAGLCRRKVIISSDGRSVGLFLVSHSEYVRVFSCDVHGEEWIARHHPQSLRMNEKNDDDATE